MGATSGTLSIIAVARPVTRFVAPGPLVATHTRPPGSTRVSVRGVGGRLLVPHECVVEFGRTIQRIVERKDGPTGMPEQHADPL